MKSNLVKEFLKPVRIISKSSNIQNTDALFQNESKQVYLKENNYLSCKGQGYIILDFGKEIHGGLRLLSYYLEGQKTLLRARVRFGESVGECCAELGEKGACSDHSVRDLPIFIPDLSDQEWGSTGFRFVRIDFLDDDKEYRLVNIYASSTHRDLQYVGDFKCNDALVNTIYDTARYTIYVNMQDNLWEGIKRDRLVWIGDMQPEVLAITDLFGANELVEEALETSAKKTPLPAWFGNIPTYSFWFIQIIYDYYLKVNNKDFVLRQMPYIEGVLEQLDGCVTESGDIDYSRISVDARNGYFLDWPTNGTRDAKAGNRFMFIYVLNNLKKMYSMIDMKEHPLCDSLLDRLQLVKEDVNAKQIVALGYLSNQLDKQETAQKLLLNGASGLSTFMSYFILRAIAESSDVKSAIDIMKDYYGAMTSRGATSYWEDFDIEWLEGSGRIDEPTPEGLKDLHGDFGKFCYKGFRHSLCHGWSCGPVQFLVEKVLGIEVLTPGCDTISIKPDLGSLEWAEGKFPTPYGVVTVACRKENGNTIVDIDAPSEITIIK